MKTLKRLAFVVLTLVAALSMYVFAYAETLAPAGSKLAVGTEYYTVLNGAPSRFSFTTPAQEGYISVYVKNNNMREWVYFYVMTGSGDTLEKDDLNENNYREWEFKSEINKRNEARMEPSTTYYIKVGSDSFKNSGNAKMIVKFTPDVNPNGKEEAENISLNTSITRSIDSNQKVDYDYFKFTADRTSVGQFSITNSAGGWLDYQVRKLGSDEIVKNLKSRDINDNVYLNDTHYHDFNMVQGEKYYVKVWKSGKGNYTFSVNNQVVKSISMPASISLANYNDCKKLNPTVAPATAYNKKLKFESSNTSVAWVNEEGEVYARDPGFAVVKATSTDGTNVSASCIVSVCPRDGSIPRVKTAKEKTLTLTWDKMTGIKGYVISYKKSSAKKWSTKTTTNNQIKISGLTSGTAYVFKLKGYITVNGKKVYGKDSTQFRTCTLPQQTKITKVTRLSTRKYYSYGKYLRAKVTWKKIKGAGSYKLYYRKPGSTYFYLVGTYSTNHAVFEKYYSRYSSETKNLTFYVAPVKRDCGNTYEGKKSKGRFYKMR